MNGIYGAIIGDIVGSSFEVEEMNAFIKKEKVSREKRIKNSQEEFFTSEKQFTDDTILSVAIMNAILKELDYKNSLKEYGVKKL